jgi:hypothetical protein
MKLDGPYAQMNAAGRSILATGGLLAIAGLGMLFMGPQPALGAATIATGLHLTAIAQWDARCKKEDA